MCYSWQSSISSFFIGTTCSLYLLHQKDKYIKHAGAFFVIVCLMQLVEFFIWIDQDCGWLNDLASRFIVMILSLQILTLYFGGLYFKTIDSTFLYHPIIASIISICSLYYGFVHLFIKDKLCSKETKPMGLKWDKVSDNYQLPISVYFIIFNILFLILSYESNIWKLITIIGIFHYYITSKEDYSYWCFYSAGIPLVITIYLLLNNNI
tara:strand:- start:31 stop:654 length:624 start_codon:yes stop_codon:yes gene_type:complete